jgi:DNA-binding response OmpR family regulator
MSAEPLAGQTVLIVEDRYLIAAQLAEELERLGARVAGPCARLQAAADALAREPVTAAILDVNLDGQAVYPLAEALADRGVPFLFLTGYDAEALPSEWRGRPRLTKPVELRALREALSRLAPPSA